MRRAYFFGLVLAFASVLGSPAAVAQGGPTPVTVTIVHLNDVYEIQPVEGGKSGGLARVATVIDELKKASSPVLTTLGGDYLSPSALGTARVDGQALAGRQMVDVLNLTGLDWATFGNHEFDVSEAAFRAHLTQATFRIVSSNVTDASGQSFPGVPTSAIVPITAAGRTVKLGLIGLTLGATKKPWVKYRDPIEAARAEVARLRGQVDVIIALTHLSLAQDAEFVVSVPEVDLVLGGHEHENWQLSRGPRFVPIVKADANVRSLAVVSLAFGAPGTRPQIATRLQAIDDTIASKPSVDAAAKKWTTVAFDAFRRDGFTPETIVATSTEPLDGRESTVRNRPGRLTDLITKSLADEVKQADLAVFNGGSVRIDDVVPAGPITEYDIIRILPFGGKVVKAVFDGALVARVLEMGVNNQGLGGFLHTWNVRYENGGGTIGGKPLDPAARYTVALTDFLLTGGEINMGFLTRTNPQVHDVQEFRDIRRTVIEAMAAAYPVKQQPRRP
ncbi:MAG: bifunctional metallophosphatase/5'-nucleotidase [Acidobacteria bacterium]|nr:bifunctional metallophosphatase/5'-nucleotidase [Acidobacteriota bacterium]